MTYDELVAAIQDTVENEFQTEDIDRFIGFAEKRIFDIVDLPQFRKAADPVLSTTNGNRFLTLPDDFRSPSSFAVISASNVYTYLINVDEDFILESYPNPSTTGVPVYYAVDTGGAQLILGPTPNADLTTLLNYNYYPASLVTDTTGTWLSDNFPTVLTKAALLEAAIFLKEEEDVVKVYTNEMNEALTLIKNFGDARLRRDNYRSGAVRAKAL